MVRLIRTDLLKENQFVDKRKVLISFSSTLDQPDHLIMISVSLISSRLDNFKYSYKSITCQILEAQDGNLRNFMDKIK